VRFGNWKVVFMEQRCPGTLAVWAEPFVPLRMPKLFNLRTDPFERADTTSNTYYNWFLSKVYMLAAASGMVERFLATFKDYPPRQRAASLSIDQALEKMRVSLGSSGH
jgi:arylsulfatase